MNSGASIIVGRPSPGFQTRQVLPPYAIKKACEGQYLLRFAEFTYGANYNAQLDGFPRFAQKYIFSDETPAGFYRWLIGIAAEANSGVGLIMPHFHIVPPEARVSISEGKFFQGDGFAAHQSGGFGYPFRAIFPPTVASVKISPGSVNTSGTDGVLTQNFSQVDSVGGMPLAVPDGWRLLCWQDGDSFSDVNHLLIMRIMYYELLNGTPPPTVTRQAQ